MDWLGFLNELFKSWLPQLMAMLSALFQSWGVN